MSSEGDGQGRRSEATEPILEAIRRFVQGDFSPALPLEALSSERAALHDAINLLGEALGDRLVRLAAQERMLLSILDGITQPIVVIGSTGETCLANLAAREALGVTAPLPGLCEIVSPAWRPGITALRRWLPSDGVSRRIPLVLILATGEQLVAARVARIAWASPEGERQLDVLCWRQPTSGEHDDQAPPALFFLGGSDSSRRFESVTPALDPALAALARSCLLPGGWASCVHPADLRRCQQTLDELLTRGTDGAFEYRFRPEGGEEIHVREDLIMLAPDEEGHARVLVTWSDVTARRVRETERTLHGVLKEASGEALLETGPDGTIRRANRAAVRLLAYAESDLRGVPLSKVLVTSPLDANGGRGAAGARREALAVDSAGTAIPVELTLGEFPRTLGGGAWVLLRDARALSRAEQTRRERERWYSGLIAESPVILYARDVAPPHRITFMSENVEHLLGVPAGLFLTDPDAWAERIHPMDRLEAQERTVRMSTAGGRSLEYRLRDDTGRYRWLRDDLRGRDRSGRPLPMLIGSWTIIDDIRELTEALGAERSLFHSLFERSQDAVFILDEQAELILECNARAVELYLQPRDELVGRPVSSLFERTEEPRRRRRLSSTGEFVGIRADGARFAAAVSLDRLPPAGPLRRSCLIVRDLSDIRENERRLEELLARAEAASRTKDTFLANMSHELRTPLNAIIGFAELLEMAHATLAPPSNETVQRNLRQISASGRHLLTLINDILDISRIEAGRLDLRPERCEPLALVEAVLSALSPLIRQAGLEVERRLPSALPPLTTDPTRLRQIFTNVLSNAIKFTPPGGRITLSAEVEGDQLVVTIADTGPGIPPSERSRLFLAFERLGSSASRTDGSGLGLALTKRLVDLLGGRIDIESAVGGGTLVRVSLALTDRTLNELPGAAGMVLHRRVWVIERHPGANAALVEGLTAAGCALGAEVRVSLEAIAAFAPDVVILDFVGGPELARKWLAELARLPTRPPLIALIGAGRSLDARRKALIAFELDPAAADASARLVEAVRSLPAGAPVQLASSRDPCK